MLKSQELAIVFNKHLQQLTCRTLLPPSPLNCASPLNCEPMLFQRDLTSPTHLRITIVILMVQSLAFGAFMNFFKLCLSFSIALSGLVLFQPHSVQGAPVAERFFRFDAIDLQGQNHLLSQYDSQKARVFVFLSTSCPIANSYTQELNRLSLIARDSVEFYGVVSEPK